MQQLQRLQNRALRICLKCNIRKYHVTELHTICDIETVQRRMDKLMLSLMYNRSLKLRSDEHDENACAHINVRVTRKMTKVTFELPHLVGHFYKRSPYYRGVVLWDALPAGVQLATTKVKFKDEVDKIKDLRAKIKKGYN